MFTIPTSQFVSFLWRDQSLPAEGPHVKAKHVSTNQAVFGSFTRGWWEKRRSSHRGKDPGLLECGTAGVVATCSDLPLQINDVGLLAVGVDSELLSQRLFCEPLCHVN